MRIRKNYEIVYTLKFLLSLLTISSFHLIIQILNKIWLDDFIAKDTILFYFILIAIYNIIINIKKYLARKKSSIIISYYLAMPFISIYICFLCILFIAVFTKIIFFSSSYLTINTNNINSFYYVFILFIIIINTIYILYNKNYYSIYDNDLDYIKSKIQENINFLNLNINNFKIFINKETLIKENKITKILNQFELDYPIKLINDKIEITIFENFNKFIFVINGRCYKEKTIINFLNYNEINLNELIGSKDQITMLEILNIN